MRSAPPSCKSTSTQSSYWGIISYPYSFRAIFAINLVLAVINESFIIENKKMIEMQIENFLSKDYELE